MLARVTGSQSRDWLGCDENVRVDMQEIVDSVVDATAGVDWSIMITGRADVAAAHDADRRLRTASVGKLLLLVETARQIEDGRLDPAEQLRKDRGLAVADSGLWQHLTTDTLPVADLAVLIAAVSDNYATNVLLGRIGLGALADLADDLGLRDTALPAERKDARFGGGIAQDRHQA